MSRSKIQIDVRLDAQAADPAYVELLTRCANAALSQQAVSGPAELSIVVTGDGQLRRLNRSFRGMDEPTDVLAFHGAEGDGFISPLTAPRHLGDVVMSIDRARAQANLAGHSVEAELQLLTVHGVLHLLGHDHDEPGKKAAMWEAQASILFDLAVPVSDPTPEPGE